jgi:hypothetical protein
MPTRKPKPYRHPRSLDALFPRPVVKRCARGHSQTPEWRMSWGCSTCRKEEEAFAARQLERTYERQISAAVERKAWQKALPQLPDPYVLRDFHGRVVGVYRAAARRGPKRRTRISRRA